MKHRKKLSKFSLFAMPIKHVFFSKTNECWDQPFNICKVMNNMLYEWGEKGFALEIFSLSIIASLSLYMDRLFVNFTCKAKFSITLASIYMYKFLQVNCGRI